MLVLRQFADKRLGRTLQWISLYRLAVRAGRVAPLQRRAAWTQQYRFDCAPPVLCAVNFDKRQSLFPVGVEKLLPRCFSGERPLDAISVDIKPRHIKIGSCGDGHPMPCLRTCRRAQQRDCNQAFHYSLLHRWRWRDRHQPMRVPPRSRIAASARRIVGHCCPLQLQTVAEVATGAA